MDPTILLIVWAANIISIGTGLIILITFFTTFKKTDFKTKRNMLIGAFVFILLDPILVLIFAGTLSGYGASQALNYSNLSYLLAG